LEKLPPIGQEVLLYTALIVRENSQILFGFQTEEERDCFELLLAINGVGPKIAQSLLGHLSPSQLQEVIITQDLIRLTKIPGIGKKTAERLIMEMKSKLKDIVPSAPLPEIGLPKIVASQAIHDAISALMQLGYAASTAQKA